MGRTVRNRLSRWTQVCLTFLGTLLAGCSLLSEPIDETQHARPSQAIVQQKSLALARWHEHQLRAIEAIEHFGVLNSGNLGDKKDYQAILEVQEVGMRALLKEMKDLEEELEVEKNPHKLSAGKIHGRIMSRSEALSMWCLHQARAMSVLEHILNRKIGEVNKQRAPTVILNEQRSAVESLINQVNDLKAAIEEETE